MTRAAPRVSVAIPIFNERHTIERLLERLRATLDTLSGGPHEVVFVDDGSTDGTAEWLREQTLVDKRLAVVSFSRNFGHQAAISAGLDYARGDVVVVMDGDLQDPPEAIPTLLRHYAEGNDVVYAVRVKRKEGLVLRACYALFYRLLRSLSEVEMPLQAGDFGLMSARVVAEIRTIPERHRFVRGLRTWVGFRQIGVEIEREARHAGDSKFSASKLLQLAIDGLFSFSIKPIRAATLIGALSVLASMLYAMYAVFARVVLGQVPQGFTTLILFIVFMAGLQITFLGVLGEYIGRIYEEVKRRPQYIVRSVHGRD